MRFPFWVRSVKWFVLIHSNSFTALFGCTEMHECHDGMIHWLKHWFMIHWMRGVNPGHDRKDSLIQTLTHWMRGVNHSHDWKDSLIQIMIHWKTVEWLLIIAKMIHWAEHWLTEQVNLGNEQKIFWITHWFAERERSESQSWQNDSLTQWMRQEWIMTERMTEFH